MTTLDLCHRLFFLVYFSQDQISTETKISNTQLSKKQTPIDSLSCFSSFFQMRAKFEDTVSGNESTICTCPKSRGCFDRSFSRPKSLYLTTFSKLKINNPARQTSCMCISEYTLPVLVAIKQGNIPGLRDGGRKFALLSQDLCLVPGVKLHGLAPGGNLAGSFDFMSHFLLAHYLNGTPDTARTRDTRSGPRTLSGCARCSCLIAPVVGSQRHVASAPPPLPHPLLDFSHANIMGRTFRDITCPLWWCKDRATSPQFRQEAATKSRLFCYTLGETLYVCSKKESCCLVDGVSFVGFMSQMDTATLKSAK